MSNFLKKKAIDYCKKKNLRLTDSRMHVLNIIASSRKPQKAYDILDKLGSFIKNPKPPTVYRAIEFWIKNKFIHRVESLNAYFLCQSDHIHEGSQVLICEKCGSVTESNIFNLPAEIKEYVEKNTFNAENWNLEIRGSCQTCS